MVWSSGDMTKRYQRMTDPIRKKIAKQIGGGIWKPEKKVGKGEMRSKKRDDEVPGDFQRVFRGTTETRNTFGRHPLGPGRRVFHGLAGGGYEIRTREGFPPTRFPTVLSGVQ